MIDGNRPAQDSFAIDDDPVVIIHDARRKRWLSFNKPERIITVHALEDVIPALSETEDWTRQGHYAAGFVSYEAAPVFDAALKTHETSDFPLLWFGLYRNFEGLESLHHLEFKGHLKWHTGLDNARHSHILSTIKNYLASGDTYQVNFSMRMQSNFDGSAWAFFQKLIQNHQPAYGAFIHIGRFSVCSASPELFFQTGEGILESRPMKGTRHRGRTLEEDQEIRDGLMKSPKDRAENLMIVDMIRNDMGRIAVPGSVKVDSLFKLEKYPSVWQMTSSVSCNTNASVTEIFQSLFPCASITGAPKPRTMEIIRELESSPRKIYTGAIGFITPQNRAQFNVTIRTALIDHHTKTVEYGVGGGIVWDSDPAQEYQECLNKAAILQNDRPDFEILETLLWTPQEGIFLQDRHIRRMCRSAEYFDYPVTEDAIYTVLDNLIKTSQNNADSFRIRLLLDRTGKLKTEIHRLESNSNPKPIRLKLAQKPVDKENPFLYHKTTNRSVYEAAKEECPDCDDVILWNDYGEITETTIFNIVMESDGKRYTPPVQCGLLVGTFREYLLEQGEIEEKIITKEMLANCDQIYCINSVRKRVAGVLGTN